MVNVASAMPNDGDQGPAAAQQLSEGVLKEGGQALAEQAAPSAAPSCPPPLCASANLHVLSCKPPAVLARVPPRCGDPDALSGY